MGGAIFVSSTATVTVGNVALTSNQAVGGAGAGRKAMEVTAAAAAWAATAITAVAASARRYRGNIANGTAPGSPGLLRAERQAGWHRLWRPGLVGGMGGINGGGGGSGAEAGGGGVGGGNASGGGLPRARVQG